MKKFHILPFVDGTQMCYDLSALTLVLCQLATFNLQSAPTCLSDSRHPANVQKAVRRTKSRQSRDFVPLS